MGGGYGPDTLFGAGVCSRSSRRLGAALSIGVLFWRLGLRRCWWAVPGGPCLAGGDSLAGIFRWGRKLDRDAADSDALNQDDSWTDAAAILRSLIDEIRRIPRSVDNDP